MIFLSYFILSHLVTGSDLFWDPFGGPDPSFGATGQTKDAIMLCYRKSVIHLGRKVRVTTLCPILIIFSCLICPL